MSKDFSNHKQERVYRQLFCYVLFLIILVLLIVLIVYLLLRPSKPKFYLQDATVLQFYPTQPNPLTSQLQVTISSRNPIDRISVLYDCLLQVPADHSPLPDPPIYKGHKDADVWSPYLTGFGIPIASFLGEALQQDEANGFFFMFVKIDCRIRWKVES